MTFLQSVVRRGGGLGGPRFCPLFRAYRRGRWRNLYQHAPAEIYVSARVKAAEFIAAAARLRRLGGNSRAAALTAAQCLAVARAWNDQARKDQPLP